VLKVFFHLQMDMDAKKKKKKFIFIVKKKQLIREFTLKCWNNQVRIIDVADLGNIPRFFWRRSDRSSFSSHVSLSKFSSANNDEGRIYWVWIGNEHKIGLISSLLITLSSSSDFESSRIISLKKMKFLWIFLEMIFLHWHFAF